MMFAVIYSCFPVRLNFKRQSRSGNSFIRFNDLGTGVSCIATDSLNSGALAIASEDGQLLVYMHNLESSAKCQY